MKTEVQGTGMSTTLLLAVLVIAATAGVMMLVRPARDDDGAAGGASKGTAAEPLEIMPLVSSGRIAESSWSNSNRERPVSLAEEDASPLDLVSMPDSDREEEERARKSLEETVRNIEGLGIYVAPTEPANTNEPKKGSR